MFIKGEMHEVNYPKGLVDKDAILNLMSQVELFPEEEYGDYGEVLESTNYCNYGEIMGVVADADVVEAIPKSEVRKMLRDCADKVSDSILDIVRKEYIHRSEDEARLKADMVAILTEIQLEIEELDLTDIDPEYEGGANDTREIIDNLIQQKINELKENTDDKRTTKTNNR